MKKKIAIHWFRFDLRVCDNPSLNYLSKNGLTFEVINKSFTQIKGNININSGNPSDING